MAGSNITLKQLSSILGVSISTISKALNDSHEISDADQKSDCGVGESCTTISLIKLRWVSNLGKPIPLRW